MTKKRKRGREEKQEGTRWWGIRWKDVKKREEENMQTVKDDGEQKKRWEGERKKERKKRMKRSGSE